MTSVDQALLEAKAKLEAAGIDKARAEARVLLAHTLGLSAAQILMRGDDDLEAGSLRSFLNNVVRRADGMPLAYITGTREFWSLPLKVTPATLIPRPDSESLIELAVTLFKGRTVPETILDLGTGSGCLLLALLTEFKESKGVGVDISTEACHVAKANAATLELDDRSDWVTGSWSDLSLGRYDLIVSNPPYIRAGDIAALDDVRDWACALDGWCRRTGRIDHNQFAAKSTDVGGVLIRWCYRPLLARMSLISLQRTAFQLGQ